MCSAVQWESYSDMLLAWLCCTRDADMLEQCENHTQLQGAARAIWLGRSDASPVDAADTVSRQVSLMRAGSAAKPSLLEAEVRVRRLSCRRPLFASALRSSFASRKSHLPQSLSLAALLVSSSCLPCSTQLQDLACG